MIEKMIRELESRKNRLAVLQEYFREDIKNISSPNYENNAIKNLLDMKSLKVEIAQLECLLATHWKSNVSLLKAKGFSLNEYPDGKLWELVVKEDEELKRKICKTFQTDMELIDGRISIDTLILQCEVDLTNCVFYYDCNHWSMETEDFLKCVKQL